MRITVFGCGYVGLTTAVGLAEMGYRVLGIDKDPKKLAILKKGRVPFYEPGLAELLQRNIKEKRLSFSDDARLGIEESDIIYSAVGTPPRKDHHADLTAVLEVAKAFGRYGAGTSARGAKNAGARGGTSARGAKVFINKSTVPVGTSEEIRKTIEKEARNSFAFDVVSNPEFLREGSAVQDFLTPDRIIVGLEKNSLRLKKLVKAVYRPMADAGVPIYFTDIRSSEVIKYASNAYLATRISLINELAGFCEAAGADIKKVARGMGLDTRIGTHYLEAGPGFGGSCLPKDVTALIETGRKRGFDFELLKAVRAVNRRQGESIVAKLKKALGKLKGKNIAVWGLAFKPKTDDIREAPAIGIISALIKAGSGVNVYDPAAIENVRAIFGKKVNYYSNYYSALRHSEGLLILTEWDEFRSPDYAKMKSLMKGNYILDGRNILDPVEAKKAGFEYSGVGRE